MRLCDRTQRRRRGTAYMAVVGASLLVTVIGLGSLMLTRLHHRTLNRAALGSEARFYAQSAVEAVIGASHVYPTWRTYWGLAHGETYGPLPLGNGRLFFTLEDPADGDLTDDLSEAIKITGTGNVDGATFSLSAMAKPPALECLSKAVSATQMFTISSGDTLTVVGAPACCHEGDGLGAGLFTVLFGSKVDGDVEAATLVKFGTITGESTTGIDSVKLPDSDTVDYYVTRATPIPYGSIDSGTIRDMVLSNTQNPMGAVDLNGLYTINTGSNDLTIENCRIQGTLVIAMGSGKKLEIKKGVYWEPARPDYPALIVNGGSEVRFHIENPLDEEDADTNFNPAGMPYQGQPTDSDKQDEYPSKIKGVVHVASSATTTLLEKVSEIDGCLICAGPIHAKDTTKISHDANLVSNPPRGYTASYLNIVDGTWRRETPPDLSQAVVGG